MESVGLFPDICFHGEDYQPKEYVSPHQKESDDDKHMKEIVPKFPAAYEYGLVFKSRGTVSGSDIRFVVDHIWTWTAYSWSRGRIIGNCVHNEGIIDGHFFG